MKEQRDERNGRGTNVVEIVSSSLPVPFALMKDFCDAIAVAVSVVLTFCCLSAAALEPEKLSFLFFVHPSFLSLSGSTLFFLPFPSHLLSYI